MSTEANQIRARIEALLAELPDDSELAELPAQADWDRPWAQLARRLEEAHEVLVHALESVEKG